jgi:hypothetical protein
LARRPAILAEPSRGSSQSSRQMSRLYLKLGHDRFVSHRFQFIIKKTPWLWSDSELCRPSDRRFLAK